MVLAGREGLPLVAVKAMEPCRPVGEPDAALFVQGGILHGFVGRRRARGVPLKMEAVAHGGADRAKTYGGHLSRGIATHGIHPARQVGFFDFPALSVPESAKAVAGRQEDLAIPGIAPNVGDRDGRLFGIGQPRPGLAIVANQGVPSGNPKASFPVDIHRGHPAQALAVQVQR